MNSAGVEGWSEATAYYSFADDPGMLALWFWLCVALCVIPLITAMRHESEIARRYRYIDHARAGDGQNNVSKTMDHKGSVDE